MEELTAPPLLLIYSTMTILQQHIDFNIGMQKIASNVNRNFQPEEIDWLLNQTIGRFVKDKINANAQLQEKGFSADQLDLDAIRTLLVEGYELNTYKKGAGEPFFSVALPSNYSFLITDQSGIFRDCESGYRSDFISSSETIYSLTIADDPGDTPYYKNAVLSIAGVDTQIKFPTNIAEKEELFTYIDAIKNAQLPNVYWEKYKDIYKSNNFIIVQTTGAAPIFAFTGGTSTGQLLTEQNIVTSPITTYTHRAPNRLARGSQRTQLQASTFAKTQWRSPISSLSSNTLKVYHDNKFIVTKVWIDYIRKPRKVSLSLGSNCDLPEDFHEQITQLAVEYAKQAIMDPNYQWKLQDNQLRNKI